MGQRRASLASVAGSFRVTLRRPVLLERLGRALRFSFDLERGKGGLWVSVTCVSM